MINKCPLCGSVLSTKRYLKVVGIWESREKLERQLKEQLKITLEERKKLSKERNRLKREAYEKGRKREKKRADILAKLIEGKTEKIIKMNKTIADLREQLKRGTTPQVEGLNLETELVRELKKHFPEDKIEHHGKVGDVLQYVIQKKQKIGTIVYECKRTERFNVSFIPQIRRAMIERKATYGILVTTAFKRGTAGFWVEKDIIVVHPYGAAYVAEILRKWIIELQLSKLSETEIRKRAIKLMEYVKSDNFRNAIEDSILRTQDLYDALKKEAKMHVSIWGQRHSNYEQIHNNISLIKENTKSILRGDTHNKTLEVEPLPTLMIPTIKKGKNK